MKTKNILLIALLALLTGMASCQKDHDIPTGKVFNGGPGGGSTTDSLTISVTANPSEGGTVSGGGKYLKGKTCVVAASANEGYVFSNWTENGTQVSTSLSYSFTVDADRTFVANFTASNPSIPLISTSIEWIRKGANLVGNTEEEMAALGLKWTGSYKEVFTTIEPIENATMYVCDGDDFASITTMDEKATYFTNLAESSIPFDKYRNISVDFSTDYNDMLAVVYGEGLFLIHITHAEIETGNFGTQITITGEAK